MVATQPLHIQRSQVILVMPLRWSVATDTTRLTDKDALLDGHHDR